MTDQTTPTPEPTTPTDPLERLAASFEAMVARDNERTAEMERRIQEIAATVAGGEPRTPTLTTEEHRAGPLDSMSDRFDMLGYTRADYELAAMMFEGSHKISRPLNIAMPEDFKRAFGHHVFETGKAIWVTDGNGKPLRKLDAKRAMDTQETGFGLELIGAQYITDMWMAARNSDSLVGRVREIPMAAPTVYVPIDGALPEMLFVGESTSPTASAYTTSKTASNRISLSAKKFTIQQIWSGELDEDSIIAFAPFLREKLNMSAGLHLGSAYLNGDTTNAGTGNINLDDADPADTKHYLAWDGIRHYWLVDATGQGKSMAAALDTSEINVARGKLNGADDDIDNAVGNINWGTNASELLLVADWDTYMALLGTDLVQTVDKYGAQATVVTGELGRIYGIPIIAPSYATKTEADGKASTTEASNTKGQLTLFNPRGFLGGVRREVQLFFDRIQRTDQFLFELYTRRAFTRFGGNVAAGVYNISL